MEKFLRYFPVWFLWMNGIMYCVLALLFVLNPHDWFANLGVTLQDPVGYTELQTMYIGLMAALGIYFILAAWQQNLQAGGLLLAFISYTALAVVRGWGILVDGVFNDLMLQLLVIELISAAAAGIGLYCHARSLAQS